MAADAPAAAAVACAVWAAAGWPVLPWGGGEGSEEVGVGRGGGE